MMTRQNAAHGVSVKLNGRHRRKIQVGVDISSREEIQKILAPVEGRWRPLFVTGGAVWWLRRL